MNDYYDPTKKIQSMLKQTTSSLKNPMLKNIRSISAYSSQLNSSFKLLNEKILSNCKLNIDILRVSTNIEANISSVAISASSIITETPTIKIGVDSILPCLKAVETLHSKYSVSSKLNDWDFEKDSILMSECQIELEDISIQQMTDVLTGEYSEQKSYKDPNIIAFNQKASEIDINDKLDDVIVKLDELLIEARQFKNNVKSNETIKNTFLRIISDALSAEMIVLAFKLLLIFLGYTFTNIEIVHDFLMNLVDLL